MLDIRLLKSYTYGGRPLTVSRPPPPPTDPVVLDIRPLKSYTSGGRPLTVHGRRFDSVQQPRMMVFNETDLSPINVTVSSVSTWLLTARKLALSNHQFVQSV